MKTFMTWSVSFPIEFDAISYKATGPHSVKMTGRVYSRMLNGASFGLLLARNRPTADNSTFYPISESSVDSEGNLSKELDNLNGEYYCAPAYAGPGGVVHITIKPGGIHQSLSRNPSILYFVPLGYQLPRYFEAPRYDQGEDMPYDERNTLWWDPNVTLADGRAPLEFFNNDLSDYPYIIRIEGLSADGRPFSRHCLVEPQ